VRFKRTEAAIYRSGLLQMGERGPRRPSAAPFSVHESFPFPRTEQSAWNSNTTNIPWKSQIYCDSPAPRCLSAQCPASQDQLRMRSAHAWQLPGAGEGYPLRFAENTRTSCAPTFEGRDVNLAEDFVAAFDIDKAGGDTLAVITHRNLSARSHRDRDCSDSEHQRAGILRGGSPVGAGTSNSGAKANPSTSGASAKTVLILFDTSFPCSGKSLERSYQALETLLRALKPEDKFNLILFNSQIQPFQPAPVAAETSNVQHAWTSCEPADCAAAPIFRSASRSFARVQCFRRELLRVLLSDGRATEGQIRNANWRQLMRTNGRVAGDEPPQDLHLCGRRPTRICRCSSCWPQRRRPRKRVVDRAARFQTDFFSFQIGRSPVGQLGLTVSPDVRCGQPSIPCRMRTFAGSRAAWVGRYQIPAQEVWLCRPRCERWNAHFP